MFRRCALPIFFFNDTATTEIYTLSLHDALPIYSLTIPYTLSNIGDTKTLVIHPGSTISLHSTGKQKEDAGVFEDLIRVSVGIEDIDDLKEDFAQAFLNIAD